MNIIGQIQTLLNSAGFDPGPIDSIWGARSQTALDAAAESLKTRSGGPPDAPKAPDVSNDQTPVDARSEGNIATLHPRVRPLARALVNRAKEIGIKIVITSGTRTYDEQNELYEQGRSKPGRVVTNARGGGSNHNFGIAFDQTVFEGASPKWEGPEYAKVGKLGKALGLAWGGDWVSIKDEPHFEARPDWASDMSESQMLAELRSRHSSGTDAFA